MLINNLATVKILCLSKINMNRMFMSSLASQKTKKSKRKKNHNFKNRILSKKLFKINWMLRKKLRRKRNQ